MFTRQRLAGGLALLIVIAMPIGVAAQQPSVPSSPAPPSPASSPAASVTPVPVGFEIPFQPGMSTTLGGLPWRPVAAALPQGIHLSRLTTWAGGFVAVELADRSHGGSRAGALWHSPDGE